MRPPALLIDVEGLCDSGKGYAIAALSHSIGVLLDQRLRQDTERDE